MGRGSSFPFNSSSSLASPKQSTVIILHGNDFNQARFPWVASWDCSLKRDAPFRVHSCSFIKVWLGLLSGEETHPSSPPIHPPLLTNSRLIYKGAICSQELKSNEVWQRKTGAPKEACRVQTIDDWGSLGLISPPQLFSSKLFISSSLESFMNALPYRVPDQQNYKAMEMENNNKPITHANPLSKYPG